MAKYAHGIGLVYIFVFCDPLMFLNQVTSRLFNDSEEHVFMKIIVSESGYTDNANEDVVFLSSIYYEN